VATVKRAAYAQKAPTREAWVEQRKKQSLHHGGMVEAIENIEPGGGHLGGWGPGSKV
jgi:hypothetical protein